MMAISAMVFSGAGAVAQNTKKEHFIAALADGRTDSILIRWAPGTTYTWQLGNKLGYKLERFTVSRNGKPTPEMMSKPSLVVNRIVPLPAASWDELVKTDERAAIVQSGIYNEDFSLLNRNADIGEMMNIQQQLDMKMGFTLLVCDLDTRFASAAGLLYTDKQVNPNERYIYRISLADAEKGKKVAQGIVSAGSAQKQTLRKPVIDKIQWGNLKASLTWHTKMNTGIYSAYYIERSENGVQFTPVTELPLITASENPANTKSVFEDSLAGNETVYYYRLKGITPFGETGPASEVVKGTGRGDFSILPVIKTGKGDNIKRKATITWMFPVEYIKEVKGYQVLRSSVAEGPYTEINPKVLGANDTLFTDAQPLFSNYYKIKALGINGEVSVSFPYLVTVYDAEPPAVPQGINGTVNDSGVVVLKWRQNRDKDLLGYRVFKANNLREEFVEVNRDFITRNAFTDTISVNTLTKEVYYKVVAVDQNFNNSKYSEPYLLKRPDLVAPTKPQFHTARMQKNGIALGWTESASDDVVKYVLQRVDKKTYNTTNLLTWNPEKEKRQPGFFDSSAVMGNIYYYQLVALDDAGNNSFGRTGEIEFETGVRKPVSDLRAVVNLPERQVTLVWSYPQKPPVERYIIYRCKKGEPMEIYKTVLGNKTMLEEKNLPVGNFYQYQVKAELEGGLRTEISKVVEVKY